MPIALDDTLKAHVILTAAGLAGPAATDAQVAAHVAGLLRLFEDGSPALAEFDREAHRQEKTDKVKAFAASVVWVDYETTSHRPVVVLRAPSTRAGADGFEIARLDRTDDAREGERAKALARQARSLIGHKVSVTIAVEVTKSGVKVRTLRGLEDRGVDDTLTGVTADNGWQYINWEHDEPRAKTAARLQFLSAARRQAAQPQPA